MTARTSRITSNRAGPEECGQGRRATAVVEARRRWSHIVETIEFAIAV